MNYIEIIEDAIQYIESNLHRNLCLEELASRYYISPMYFYRIFRAVTNQTVKSYIIGRKLSAAAIALRKTDKNVVDIAFRYGFNSHEQFTRDFVKMFHVTPSRYRKDEFKVLLIDSMDVVERDFKNRYKDIVVDCFCRELSELKLLGKKAYFNPWNTCELEEYMCMFIDFEEKYVAQGKARRLYNTVCGSRSDPSRIDCFRGIPEEEYCGDRFGLAERIIPASRYVVFKYPGFMGFVFRTVLQDLDKWLKVTDFKKNNHIGFDMIEVYHKNYEQAGYFYLYVPVL